MTPERELFAKLICEILKTLFAIALIRYGIHLALHDHPWWSAFFILWGVVVELHKVES